MLWKSDLDEHNGLDFPLGCALQRLILAVIIASGGYQAII
jgi:hypothetical protein